MRTVMDKITTRLSGPESTLILRELFGNKFYRANRENNSHEERIYGSVLYRENDATFRTSFLKPIMRDYINYNIAKSLKLTLKEYLELTPYEKMMYDDFAYECQEAMQDEIKKMEKENDLNIKKGISDLDWGDIDE